MNRYDYKKCGDCNAVELEQDITYEERMRVDGISGVHYDEDRWYCSECKGNPAVGFSESGKRRISIWLAEYASDFRLLSAAPWFDEIFEFSGDHLKGRDIKPYELRSGESKSGNCEFLPLEASDFVYELDDEE